ncbi:MAG: 23S rRNA (pseudouridine(1915)-N(3))-methyltransferase RlmH [Oxalobacteraceae bacterium]|nr:23S rRNA (pseudouridine(1915)-N(3))-methyltransferase RlmH [Oxalobacteraceae bacterium]
MQLIVAAVGHKMPAWIDTGFQEYAKRMPPDCRLVLKEIKPVEVIALDEHGEQMTTVQLSQQISIWQQQGGDVTFVIGGADGLDAGFKQSADRLLRLSSMTLPHGLVRVILAEQLYRAWSILRNHPYHRV